MADSLRIPVNALAPYALRYCIRSSRFDLTKITSAAFTIRRLNGKGAPETWVATASELQPNKALLTHTFAANEIPEEDLIVFEPSIVISSPAGTIYGETRTLVVFAHPARV